MNQKIMKEFNNILNKLNVKNMSVLEIGCSSAENEQIFKLFNSCKRFGINNETSLQFKNINDKEFVFGNAHDMKMFKDNEFQCVVSCAVFEHDPKFWLSIQEIKRVLEPNGIMIVCVPSILHNAEHGEDYYRFTKRALKEIFFEGYKDVIVEDFAVKEQLLIIGWGKNIKNNNNQNTFVQNTSDKRKI